MACGALNDGEDQETRKPSRKQTAFRTAMLLLAKAGNFVVAGVVLLILSIIVPGSIVLLGEVREAV